MRMGVLEAVAAAAILAGCPQAHAYGQQNNANANETSAAALQPPQYYQPCKDDQEDRKSDLCAQWKAADWSKASFWAAFAGVIGLVLTIGLNLEAWRQARKADGDTKTALSHAEASAKAMESFANSMKANLENVGKSVRNQELFGRAQMRAYVTVDIGGLIPQTRRTVFEVQPHVFNKGATSARKLRWRIAAEILPKPLPPGFRFPIPRDIGGGSDLDGHGDGFMGAVINGGRRLANAEAKAAMLGNGSALTVWGYLWYDDVFGKRHRRTFAQQVWLLGTKPNSPVRGIHLRHNRGN